MLDGLGDLLAAPTNDDEQTARQLSPGIDYVGFFRTFDGERCNGALIVVDLANGARLASLDQDHRDVASLDCAGVAVAIEALSNLAVQANTIVARHQSTPDSAHQR